MIGSVAPFARWEVEAQRERDTHPRQSAQRSVTATFMVCYVTDAAAGVFSWAFMPSQDRGPSFLPYKLANEKDFNKPGPSSPTS